jgi:hypothetical protein
MSDLREQAARVRPTSCPTCHAQVYRLENWLSGRVAFFDPRPSLTGEMAVDLQRGVFGLSLAEIAQARQHTVEPRMDRHYCQPSEGQERQAELWA